MACGGYVCSKNALCALNILYCMVSLLLIGAAAWGKWLGMVSSIRVVAAVIGVGVFLFLVALMGLLRCPQAPPGPAVFYMIILFVVFVLQFSVSCVCLALNKDLQNHLLEAGWNKSEATQKDVEKTLNCCGFSSFASNGSCAATCFHSSPSPSCPTCSSIMQKYAGEVLRFVGGIGLFFSFTEIFGVWLARRYRNTKDPRSNPGAFL